MAKSGRGQVPGIASTGPKGSAPGRPKGSPKGKAGKGGRASVAAARRSKGDRTQLIIGGAAILVIILVIVVGLVLHARNTATQGAGYGTSTKSVATMDAGGIVTVQNGNPTLVLDVYEDALCPLCAEFEHQYGQQIAKAIDDGQLGVRYHMVAFLDPSSHSGTYSTRAYAALMAVAKDGGSTPGQFMSFHTALYDAKNQPAESGSSDLSNEQLAKLAGQIGASAATQQLISAGADVSAAQANAKTNLDSLTAVAAKVGRQAGTPTVARDGVPLNTNDTSWLTNLLPKAKTSSSAPTS